MATLTAQTISRAGLEPVLAAADVAGDDFVNTGLEFVEVVNGSGSDVTVTLDIQSTVDGQAVTDRTVTVTAGERRIIGPFPTGTYNDSEGKMNISYSAVTSVTVGVFKLAA